jgi:hypothetical protein
MTPARRCGHWLGDQQTWCHSQVGIRLHLTGPLCPLHTPAAVAGRPEPPNPQSSLRNAA